MSNAERTYLAEKKTAETLGATPSQCLATAKNLADRAKAATGSEKETLLLRAACWKRLAA